MSPLSDFLIGDRTLVVGRRRRRSVHLAGHPRRREAGERRLTRIHEFDAHPGRSSRWRSSRARQGLRRPADATGLRARPLLDVGADALSLHAAAGADRQRVVFAPKARRRPRRCGTGDARAGARSTTRIRRSSWRALFGKVWYEGYDQPEYVWQSTGGTDDFEPKLCLTPLIFGTLKGTFYALLLAIPLALFGGALHSQFMHPALEGGTSSRRSRSWRRCRASCSASSPGSGSRRLERIVPAPAPVLPLVPLVLVPRGVLLWQTLPPPIWRPAPSRARRSFCSSRVVLLGGLAGLRALGGLGRGACSSAATSSSWLLDRRSASTYDQRNALVVGLAMGFAVIPIIFTIAEDALSNVPRT